MKKISLTLLVALMGITTTFAQISTGEPNASVLPRTGNRPQAGDFGLYLGVSATQIVDLVQLNKKFKDSDDDWESNAVFWALPAVNLKYYITDNWEFRCGFQFAAKGSTDIKKYKDYAYDKIKMSRDINYTRFLPGAAYHFNTSNILDVYVGAQLPIGFDIENNKTSYEVDGKTSSNRYYKGSFVIGGGVFMGLQVFVADLPFAIGIEAGYSGHAVINNGKDGVTTINNDGKKTKYAGKVETLSHSNAEIKSSTYMEGTWGADAAITFTYYFHK